MHRVCDLQTLLAIFESLCTNFMLSPHTVLYRVIVQNTVICIVDLAFDSILILSSVVKYSGPQFSWCCTDMMSAPPTIPQVMEHYHTSMHTIKAEASLTREAREQASANLQKVRSMQRCSNCVASVFKLHPLPAFFLSSCIVLLSCLTLNWRPPSEWNNDHVQNCTCANNDIFTGCLLNCLASELF